MNKVLLCFKNSQQSYMTPGQKPPSHLSIGWSTGISLLFSMAVDRLLHRGRAKKLGPEENFLQEEELHFVEHINRQCKTAWRIHKYSSRRGRTIYIIDSN
jgi:hypothetical protein